MTSQSETVERLQWAVDAGGLVWDPANGRYVKSMRGNADEFVREPHIVGLTGDLELGRPGSWVGALFNYQLPKIGFSRGEQRLLLAALSGATDEKLAEELRTSPNTVKNTWRSIYDRAAHICRSYSRMTRRAICAASAARKKGATFWLTCVSTPKNCGR